MNIITILIWITIALIGAIAIITVKLHYQGDKLALEEGSILPGRNSISKALNTGENLNKAPSRTPQRSLSPETSQQPSLFRKKQTQSTDNTYIVHEVEENNLEHYEYETENQVLVNYDNTVEKTQEPIKENQMDIMTQNKNNNEETEETSELKDLFTIDELIKESKRKDSEREKESQKIEHEDDTEEIDELKESIKNKKEEPLIEEVVSEDKQEPLIEEAVSEDKEETISDLISDASDESKKEHKDIPSVAPQKDAGESEKEEVSQEDETADTPSQPKTEEKSPSKEISEPVLKTPSKVDEKKDYEMGASIDDADVFGDENEDEMDLDYRKDLNKVKNKITGSKLFKEVKGKFVAGSEEVPQSEAEKESYIRNVNEYDEYEPIINETHVDYDASYEEYHDQRLRQENTRRVFNKRKNAPEPELAKPKAGSIKSKPSRANIKIELNNQEVVLKKGDEIIFNHDGETYSSQVYAINGDDISVKYRRKNIKIKPSDVKKIY